METVLNLHPQGGLYETLTAEFTAKLISSGRRYLREWQWTTDRGTSLAGISDDMIMSRHGQSPNLCIATGKFHESDILISLDLHQGSIRLIVGCDSLEIAEAIHCVVQAAVPELILPDEDPAVLMTFWLNGLHGPESFQRRIETPRWKAVASNYSARCLPVLQDLIALNGSAESGQLILLSGVAGTGKTYFIRSLCHAWKRWCSSHYVVDPDVMFGDKPSYLIRVLLSESKSPPVAVGSAAGASNGQQPWRLLILEDTGELLRADAKEQTGQSLSRMLNTVDGILGQGLRILVLITTNEELGTLHPAVIRPGRCLTNIQMQRFTSTESQAWLRAHDIPVAGDEPLVIQHQATLADLYAIKRGKRFESGKSAVGFSGERS